MSYPIGLDEYDERQLKAELVRREENRLQGLCDYCERSPALPSCKFPERHTDARIGKNDAELLKERRGFRIQ